MSVSVAFGERVPQLSEEQRLLQQTLADALQVFGEGSATWDTLARLDLLGLAFDPAEGGVGGGGLDLLVVMQALGRALVRAPYLPTVVLGGAALRLGATPELRAQLVPKIAVGEVKLALAYLEPARANVATRADPVAGGYRLCGSKTVVLGGDDADWFIVSADRQDSVTLFLVARADEGVRLRTYPLIDGRGAADLELDGVIVGEGRLLGGRGGAILLGRVLDAGAACLAAEAVGAMEAAIELTIHHLRSRHQFRRPLATFQVLRHRVVDMHVALEQSRSSAMLACAALNSDDEVERSWRASAAKALAGRHGRFVGQQVVQLHGAMGMSAEHSACRYFMRLTAIDSLLGDTRWHLRRL